MARGPNPCCPASSPEPWSPWPSWPSGHAALAEVARLTEFFGSSAGLSASAITRLTKSWSAECEAFMARDLSGMDYVYLWVDGITTCGSPTRGGYFPRRGRVTERWWSFNKGLEGIDTATLDARHRWSMPGVVSGLGLSGDARRLYVALGDRLAVLDPSTGEELVAVPLAGIDPILDVGALGA